MKIDGKKQTNKENHRETEIENGRFGEKQRDGERRKETEGNTGRDGETLEKSQSDREKR